MAIMINGKYAQAKVYTDLVEETARKQLQTLCDQPFVEGCTVRVMPDVHAGAGCVIGFTADLGQLVIPNLVGVDIGCGMLTISLGKTAVDYGRLDEVIRTYVPAGMRVHETPVVPFEKLEDLLCHEQLRNTDWLRCSAGTLGGGNHFIEVDVDDEGEQYLVIHTGSRNLGKQVAEIYQQLAYDRMFGKLRYEAERKNLIEEYRAAGRTAELADALKKLRRQDAEAALPRELCYLTGEDRAAYLHDMKICQEFAVLNRAAIAEQILQHLLGKSLADFPHFETIHNYIDHDSNIIRKGAVSAKAGEQLLIPINMRDGSLLCVGKGNPDWNCSAPHGAGRLFSRGAARKQFSVERFAKEMEGIYTTSVSAETLDECPMAYKPMESIVENIGDTVDIVKVIRPVYNFKAGE